jgi:hypothetical protein
VIRCWHSVLIFSGFVSAATGSFGGASSPVAMDRESLLIHFEVLLPLAVKWAAEEEERILREGVPLSESEIADAKAVGVREPERVRLLQVTTIPRPSDPQLAAAADAMEFLMPATRGLTLHHGVFIRRDCWRDRSLIVHELVHTAQYERLGGSAPFLRQYLLECLTFGYSAAPLEKEAVDLAARHFSR